MIRILIASPLLIASDVLKCNTLFNLGATVAGSGIRRRKS